MNYSNLFSEGTIGAITLKNRLVMSPMGCGLANLDGTPSEEMIAFYEARAIGGAGLIIPEITRINDVDGVGLLRQLTLFKRLYEDNVLGCVTNEQFRMLSADYNAELKMLQDTIPEKKSRLEKLKASVANVDAFIEKAKRYATISELTPELLRLFIQRIELGERGEKHAHSTGQTIRIIYRDIGAMDNAMEQEEPQPHIALAITSKEDILRMLA